MCQLKKVHVSLYPDQFEIAVNPLSGLVQMLQLGDRGNHKVDKLGDMAHWIMRTFKPSLQCSVFGSGDCLGHRRPTAENRGVH